MNASSASTEYASLMVVESGMARSIPPATLRRSVDALLTDACGEAILGWPVRVSVRPRLLLAVLVAELALGGPWAAREARASKARIEDIEDSLLHDRSFKVRVDAA